MSKMTIPENELLRHEGAVWTLETDAASKPSVANQQANVDHALRLRKPLYNLSDLACKTKTTGLGPTDRQGLCRSHSTCPAQRWQGEMGDKLIC